jgi:hypothetical protein
MVNQVWSSSDCFAKDTKEQRLKAYNHNQRGTVIIVVTTIITAAFMTLGTTVFRPVLVAVPILLVCGWLFHSLTIEVADGELRWHFGPGFLRRRVHLAEISKAEQVRINVIEGWGIHLSRFGWLYNVSGFDAVAITLKSGKHFALGTDEPAALLAALDTSQH